LERKLMVGLGNPGEKYQDTRHNAGFWLLDALANEYRVSFQKEAKFFGELARIQAPGLDVRLLKPQTFMNRSGQSVAAVAQYFGIQPQQILVAHDELDLAPGVARLKLNGGHAGHNGLRSLVQTLGSREFARLRIGIGRPEQQSAVVNYVLGRAGKDEQQAIDAALQAVLRHFVDLMTGADQQVMNRLHA
jgi:PTH1 family peptidyl-tRNA hydrolase